VESMIFDLLAGMVASGAVEPNTTTVLIARNGQASILWLT
jgi:hypothetical protein